MVLSLHQKEELLKAIVKKQEIPHKFAYLNNGDKAWDAVSNDPQYNLGKRELTTLRKFIKLVSAKLQSKHFINVLHIGPGNVSRR